MTSATERATTPRDRVWQIGIVGTFDVRNYGDLLFPIIAEAELRRRLGSLQLHRFSYNARSEAEWPYAVTPVNALPDIVGQLDALLIGGGFLIRFDKFVADDYLPTDPSIHHPTGYWLTPALTALAAGVPVAWNAPGMHCNEVPSWAEPLMKLALGESSYVSVRDQPSKETLSRHVAPERIHVVPDTAFALPQVVGEAESDAMLELRRQVGLNRPYLVVQPIRWMDDGFPEFLERHADRLAGYQLLALPIGPVLGDSTHLLGQAAPRFVTLPFWPEPTLLVELIRGASAVVGYSYHLAITALAYGVPVFTSFDLNVGKFTALRDFPSVHRLADLSEPDAFIARLGRRVPDKGVSATLPAVEEHWDRIAAVVRGGRRKVSPVFGRFWQHLPVLLESGGAAEARAGGISLVRRVKARAAKAVLRERNGLIRLERIAGAVLAKEPYTWGTVDQLYSTADGAALARTFPRDHYKLVSAYGGEKDYQYEARALIKMGESVVSERRHLSNEWQALADALLSSEYRAAMAALTGCDLATAPLEVNVFHYGPGASLGAHPDLPDKLVTHVLYFNEEWNVDDGGCLTILRSSDPGDVAAVIPPLVGNSAVLVRSDKSWHAVSPVVPACRMSRRSVTATFYRAGSISSMWPPGERSVLRDYVDGPSAKRRGWLPWLR